MKRIAQYLAIVVVTLILCELMSFAVLWTMAGPSAPHLEHQISRFHPLWRREVRDATGNPAPPYQAADERNPFSFSTRTGYSLKRDHWYSATLRTNAQGFVCNATCADLPHHKPADEYRIFVFGGSTVAGNGRETGGGDTIPGQLERILNQAGAVPGKHVRVINAGVAGFFSAQEIGRFLNEALYYDPDMVVFFHGNNDWGQWNYSTFYSDIAHYAPYVASTANAFDYTVLEGLDRVSTPMGAALHAFNMLNERYPLLFYTTTLAKQARLIALGRAGAQKAKDEANQQALPPEKLAELLWRRDAPSLYTLANDVDIAAGVARAKGIKALLCLQPALRDTGAKKVLSPSEHEIVEAAKHRNDLYFAEYYAAARAQVYAPRIARNDRQVNFCDLTRLFADETQPVFIDDIHYLVPASEKIAQALAAQIVPMIRP